MPDTSPNSLSASQAFAKANAVFSRVVVLSGMSGAGKQLAARYFEDMKWRVVDNMPPRLLPLLVDEREQSAHGESGQHTGLCAVCDVRGGRISDLLPSLELLAETGTRPVLVFLEASDEELVRRFKETRRTHPLFDSSGGVLPAIACERSLLGLVREQADLVIDTTDLHPADLRGRLVEAFAPQHLGGLGQASRQQPLTVTVASFGFKHGVPLDADLVFDVRFLRNPHYDDMLRPHDGRNKAVEAFVMADERTGSFLERLYDLVGWSLPHYVSEGKAYLTIGIGCTGGRHRSIVVSEKLAQFIRDRGYPVLVQHRDVYRVKASGSGPASDTPLAPNAPDAPQAIIAPEGKA
jgi:UPF0042 nucleotide-binding protein